MLETVSKLALAGALALAASQAQAKDEEAQARPNILLIIADDVGMDHTPGMYPGMTDSLVEQYGPNGLNHPDYKKIDGHPASTPHLDAFAEDAMVFTDAWAQPFCSPTRASMLTGLFASKTNVATYADALSQNHDSFVSHLRDEAGYSTAVFGKWHMAGLPGQNGQDYPGMKPKEAGFDLFVGNMHAALPSFWDYEINIQDASTAPGVWKTTAPTERSLPGIAPTTYAAVAKGANVIEWIGEQEASNPDKPWFTWMAFNLAHATIASNPSQMIIPNADTLDAATRAEIDACGGHYGTAEPGDCSGEAQMRAMTNSMDTIIGKVLEAVDRIDPNTYVIIVSDNGTPMYGRPNLDFIDNMYISRTGRGKGSAFESGARVAFAVRGPGVAAGSSNGEFVHVADLYATVLELAGLHVPDTVPNSAGDGAVTLDSVSLKPILLGDATRVRDPQRDVIITESTNLMKDGEMVVGARNARFKVVCTNNTANCALYDLGDDPLEEYPLSTPESCPVGPAPYLPASPAWNYCYLTGIVSERSIF